MCPRAAHATTARNSDSNAEPATRAAVAEGLLRYSERGQDRVDSLEGVVRVNKLTLANRAVFRDEPLRFPISQRGCEEAEATRQRIAQAVESGALAEIIAHARPD